MEFKEKDIIVRRANKTVYKVGNEVIKVSAPEHPKTGVFNEALITSYIESFGVPAAKVLYVKEFDGCWGLGLEYIEGQTLAEKIENEPENLEANLEKFVDIQLEVNSFRAVGLRNTIPKRTEEINALDIDPSIKWELLQRLAGMKRHTKLCHGDFIRISRINICDSTAESLILPSSTSSSGCRSSQQDSSPKLRPLKKRFCSMSGYLLQSISKR